MAGPYQRLSNGASADTGAQAITTVVNAVEAGLEAVEAALPGKASTSALTAHEADTTNIHGIADTSLLETTAGATSKANAAQAAAVQRANHTGTQLASTISNFDTQVRTSRLDQLAAPTTAVGMGSQRVTNVGTPTASTDAVTKGYADALTLAPSVSIYNVTSYGATGDGATNDTSAINSAVAALVAAGGGVLYFPKGTYRTTGGHTLSVACTVLGDGLAVTSLTTVTGTATVFTITSDSVTIRDLSISHLGTSTSGAGIAVTSNGVQCRFMCLTVYGFHTNIDIQYGAEWLIHGCRLVGNAQMVYNVRVAHPLYSGDWGDSGISDSTLVRDSAGGAGSTAHIYQTSGGGLRITGCKLNGGVVDGLRVAMDGFVTGVLTVTGNSIENFSGAGVKVDITGSGTNFVNGTITGNEVVAFVGGAIGVRLTSSGGANLSNFTIVGNAFGAATGVSLNNALNVTIAGNSYAGATNELVETGTNTGLRNIDGLV